MDTDKVIQFLKDIADQIGPLGEQAFLVVKSRVIAEALIWIGVSAFLIIVVLMWDVGVIIATSRRTDNHYYSKWETCFWATFFPTLLIVVPLLGVLGLNLINLFSPDYATIERILNLVGSSR